MNAGCRTSRDALRVTYPAFAFRTSASRISTAVTPEASRCHDLLNYVGFHWTLGDERRLASRLVNFVMAYSRMVGGAGSWYGPH